MGMILSFVAATTWVFGKTTWDHADSNDPRKQLAQEVFTTLRAAIPHFSENGSGVVAGPEKPRRRGQDAARE
jgi:hypothetical protein